MALLIDLGWAEADLACACFKKPQEAVPAAVTLAHLLVSPLWLGPGWAAAPLGCPCAAAGD